MLKLNKLFLPLILIITACSGGGGDTTKGGDEQANLGCTGECSGNNLSKSDVRLILRQAITSARLQGVAGTFAVLDRVGNVLAVYQMSGALTESTINGQIGASGGLEGVSVPASLAAISKAGTGAFLSSQGNAFSTRTASQIIQEHFYPGERNQPAGPLFGVQFSQLICSDITKLNPNFAQSLDLSAKTLATGLSGPRPLPLGLSADSGGIPLYKNGEVVGGLGVEFDGVYGLDRNIRDFDNDLEEAVALDGSRGFAAPAERVADVIIVGGKSLRYTDLRYQDLKDLPANLDPIVNANLLTIALFTNGNIRAGAVFGSIASGVDSTSRAGMAAEVLVDNVGNLRYPTVAGASLGGDELSVAEVDALLDSSLLTALNARAAIRRPADSAARVSIWVIDTLGNPLGFTRSQDAPIFGIDVALQKARSAVFFSSVDASTKLTQIRTANVVGSFEDYTQNTQDFFDREIFNGDFAITNRAIGNLARPFFTDGIQKNPNGPLSLPFPPQTLNGRSWSPFNVGLQLDLIFQRLVAPLGVPSVSVPDTCVDSTVLGNRLGNGIQIFPGSVPLYRGNVLVGAIGVSGDGVDQDDMIAYYGASRKGLDQAGHSNIGGHLGFNAPNAIRSDRIRGPIENTRLRYVNCPESPFRDNDDQNVCG